jgi:hypothetical protein
MLFRIVTNGEVFRIEGYYEPGFIARLFGYHKEWRPIRHVPDELFGWSLWGSGRIVTYQEEIHALRQMAAFTPPSKQQEATRHAEEFQTVKHLKGQ